MNQLSLTFGPGPARDAGPPTVRVAPVRIPRSATSAQRHRARVQKELIAQAKTMNVQYPPITIPAEAYDEDPTDPSVISFTRPNFHWPR